MFIEISEPIRIVLIIDDVFTKNDYEMCLYWFCMGQFTLSITILAGIHAIHLSMPLGKEKKIKQHRMMMMMMRRRMIVRKKIVTVMIM